MKTPDEIKKALDCCSKEGCAECQYKDAPDYDECTVMMAADALAYIRCLEAERDALLDALRITDQECAYCIHADICDHLCEDDEFCCSDCKIFELCPCVKCNAQKKCWEWRGLDKGGAENDKRI